MTEVGQQQAGGVRFRPASAGDIEAIRAGFRARLAEQGYDRHVSESVADGAVTFHLRDDVRREWLPEWDTLGIAARLNLDVAGNPADQEREIVLALLGGPVPFEYPSLAGFESVLRVRCNIATAAAKTALSFDTSKAERPLDYWAYVENCGFTLLPGKSLVDALRLTTQPEASGTLYSFSCYRATEYVILLGLAMELATCNPPLLQALEDQWRQCAIMSARFHDVFLHEYGSMETPLPPRYYVPGDRLWFRNPDERSADVTGFEGSWVFYHGGGLFTNFWKRDLPYTLESKCLEIFHWRDGYCCEPGERPWMDEDIVAEHVQATLADPERKRDIMARMLRYRDPRGVYQEGGCIDTTREYPRRVCPGSPELVLPELDRIAVAR
ncbi:MAG: hypothetical protein HZC22_19065 [Rhodocyclales bacterium]|nr:hypothetical protein [Rhodocyclales bacterium]